LLLKWHVMENRCVTFTSSSQLLINFCKTAAAATLRGLPGQRRVFPARRGHEAMPESTATWKMVFVWKVTGFGSFCTQPGPASDGANVRTGLSTYTSQQYRSFSPAGKTLYRGINVTLCQQTHSSAGFRNPVGGLALETSPEPSTEEGREWENCQIAFRSTTKYATSYICLVRDWGILSYWSFKSN